MKLYNKYLTFTIFLVLKVWLLFSFLLADTELNSFPADLRSSVVRSYGEQTLKDIENLFKTASAEKLPTDFLALRLREALAKKPLQQGQLNFYRPKLTT